MIIDIENIFKFKIPNHEKLLKFGFEQVGLEFQKSILIMKNQFTMNVAIKADGSVSFKVIDNVLNEEYVLVHAENAQGGFVGEMRTICEKQLVEIAENCFDSDTFKAEQTKRILEWILKTYDCVPEFLWEKYPDFAVFRKKGTGKWFAIVMTVDKSKIGLTTHGNIEILDLKAKPELVEKYVNEQGFYPAYHMNKQHWFTVCLDGSISDETLMELISNSFDSLMKK